MTTNDRKFIVKRSPNSRLYRIQNGTVLYFTYGGEWRESVKYKKPEDLLDRAVYTECHTETELLDAILLQFQEPLLSESERHYWNETLK